MKDSFESPKISFRGILKSLIYLINNMCNVKTKESQGFEATNKCSIFGTIDKLIVIKGYNIFYCQRHGDMSVIFHFYLTE